MKIFFDQLINAVLIKAENNSITLGVASMSCEEESSNSIPLLFVSQQNKVRTITVMKIINFQLPCPKYVDRISLTVTLKLRKLCSNNSKRLQQFVLILEPAKYEVIYSQKVMLCCRCCKAILALLEFSTFRYYHTDPTSNLQSQELKYIC